MENNAYAIAFAEIYEIFKIMSKEDLEKIPNNFKEFIVKNKSNQYDPKIDKNIPLYRQRLNKETFAICSLIYRTYLISPEKRQELQDKDNKKLIELEKELREKYNPDNIFKNNVTDINKSTVKQFKEDVQLIEYKEKNIFLKFIEKLVSNIKKLLS